MTIDISKIRPGDEVTVRGVVAERHDLPHHRGFRLHVFKDDGSYHDPFVPFDAIVSHTPKELQPGDRVRLVGGHRGGRVLASEGGFVWTQWDEGGCPFTCRAHELERV